MAALAMAAWLEFACFAESPSADAAGTMHAGAYENLLQRHWTIPFLLCVLLGVLSTIALAWLCAMFMNPDAAAADFTHSPRADGGDDVVVIQRAFGHTRINRAQCSELKLDPDTGSILLARWASTGNESSETHAGWPFRALSCRNTAQISIVTGNSAMQVQRAPAKALEGGWELPAFARGRLGGAWRAIPLRPIWSGLFADIALLGALWFAIIFGFSAWRRRRRRERGRCPWCGYDLRSGGMTHERCPECGASG